MQDKQFSNPVRQHSTVRAMLIIRSLILFLVLAAPLADLHAQLTGQSFLTPEYDFDKFPGYVTINELNIGAGLGATNAPYAANYFGITTIHDYQFNPVLAGGVGTGINFYKQGIELPLFADVRVRIYKKYNVTGLAFGDGGLMFNLKNSSSEKITPRLFLNPGIGVRYDVSYTMGINFGLGVMVQQNNVRNSYINIKLGFTYKPGITGKSL
jgi:hypothetical protein